MNGKAPNSGIVVLPITIAPAARSRRTTSPSAATGVELARPPNVVTVPTTSISSLIAIGTPCSGPTGAPAASRASASASASSASTTENALSSASRARIRASACSTTSRADTSPAPTSRAVSATPALRRSLMAETLLTARACLSRVAVAQQAIDLGDTPYMSFPMNIGSPCDVSSGPSSVHRPEGTSQS